MKRVEAIVENEKLELVRSALDRSGVDGMTVSEVREFERSSNHLEQYRGAEHRVHYVAKTRVEIVVEDSRVPALLEELVRALRSGRLGGDGRIFVQPVDEAVRVRTNERGHDAL